MTWPDVRTLYRKVITFYPREFREQLEESMQQTFDDLYAELQKDRDLDISIFWIFIETGAGIIREHALVWKGDSMKPFLSNPTSAAIASFIFALPIGLLFVIFNFDIEPLSKQVESLLTANGSGLNALGRIVLIGGLLILPIAFAINLVPLFKKEGPDARRTIHTANIIVGVIILLIITVSWGGLILEEINCLQGIRCD